MTLKRIRADWPMFSAVVVTVLLAITLLAAGPIYADAAFLAGVHRTLEDAPAEDTRVAVSARVRMEKIEAADDHLRTAVHTWLARDMVAIYRTIVSDSFGLEGRDEVASVRAIQGVAGHSTLIAGSWPAAGADQVETAVHQTTAELLGLEVGDRITMKKNVTGPPVELTITGIYTPDSPSDIFWFSSQLESQGFLFGSSVDTVGPFIVDESAFGVVGALSPAVTWRVFPKFDQMNLAEVSALRLLVPQLEQSLKKDAPGEPAIRFSVDSGVGAIVRDLDRSLLATRSGILILMLQLAVLAGYALMLIAGLRIAQRRPETILLRSRGAGVRQLGRIAAIEAVIIIVPCVLLAPWLAAIALRGLNRLQPLAGIGMTLQPEIGRLAYLIAVGAGAVCVGLMAIPALRSARSVIDDRGNRRNSRFSGLFQRSGIDVLLLLVAAAGFFQLRTYGAPVTTDAAGKLEIDPLLVLAPALAMLAGAVVMLRLIPRLGSAIEFGSLQRTGLVSALGGWQVGRRAGNYARAGLLLILALSIGLFSVVFTYTWQVSQVDQVDFQIGADIRVQPRNRTAGIHPGWLPAAYRSLEGVEDVMPVQRHAATLTLDSGPVTVLLLDSARAAGIVRFRDDLASEPFDELIAALTAGRQEIPVVSLPGEPRLLAVDVQIAFDRLCEGSGEDLVCRFAGDLTPEEIVTYDRPLTPSVIVRDAAGSLIRIEAEPIEARGDTERIIFPLEAGTRDGVEMLPVYPVEVVAVEFETLGAPFRGRSGSGQLLGIVTSETATGESWTAVPIAPADWTAKTAAGAGGRGEVPNIRMETAVAGEPLSMNFNTGAVRKIPGVEGKYYQERIFFALYPGRQPTTSSLPVLVSEQLLADMSLNPGEPLHVSLLGTQQRTIVAGSLAAFPSIPETETSFLVVDLNSLTYRDLYQPGSTLQSFDEYWLTAGSGPSGTTVRVLQQAPFLSVRVIDRNERYNQLRTDPVALATIGMLALGSIVAAIFGLAGFALNALVSTRERLTEFALLRALGLSPRQLVSSLMIEHGFLAGISLVLGSALGLLLAVGVLPMISVNQRATAVFPVVTVTIPWLHLATLLLVATLAVSLTSATVTLMLRRQGLGELLRIGEDQA